MKQLDLLWRYQELEALMDNYVRERNSLPIRKELRKLQTYLLAQQKKLKELDEEANKKQNSLNKIYHEYDNIVNNLRIDGEKISDGSIRNLKQIEQLEKDADNLKEKIEQKYAELNELMNEIENFNIVLKDIGTQMNDAKKEYRKVRSIYDAQTGEIQEKYNDVKKDLDGLKKDIEKNILSRYKRLRENYNDPVAIVDKNFCCGGCNMQVAAFAVQLLKEDSRLVECENCGRILYMKEKEKQVS
ncbi:MAG: hypothetical protein GX974_02485 [Clostridiales bacterium]|nr:hypothetical protein [Clostridiales bacterium]